MTNIFWKLLLASPALAGTAFATAANAQTINNSAIAPANTLQQVSVYGAEGRGNELDQVTSVSQFSDVRPTDWAFQALQSLVERYGCIVGYPDKTYRGNRALSRYEFAAGLNACLDKIQELIAAATADFVRKEDLEVVKRLQEEFAAELASLRGRVESLEVRTATIEKQQFSTTTKLSGEVIFNIADTFGDAATITGNDNFIDANSNLPGVQRVNEDDNTETIFGNRARLSFDASFSGRDRLRTRLNAANITSFSGGAFTGTNQTRLSVDGVTGGGNAVEIDKLFYRFPVGQNLRVQIDAVNLEYYDGLVSSLSPFESSGQGSVSRFGRFNPVYRSNAPTLPGSAGITFDYAFSPNLSLQGGFSADRSSNDPSIKNGLFNGDFTAIGQLVFRPSRTFDIGLTYVRAYYTGSNAALNQPGPNLTGSTGTAYAANPFAGEATASNNFAAQVQWRIAPKITIGGWYGYNFAANRRTNEEAQIQNWAAFLAFPDLGKRGNLGGILFGMTPRVVDTDFRPRTRGVANPNLRRRLDEDPPLHLEVFYRYRVNDNISITPGVFVLFNPEGNSANNTQYVGVIRTTFTF
ncbi:MAG: iron uptake porin [Leptolyngbyaceae cyanobacterium bins.349]|nr:iron uptake porin [Leptolyngbyaceae cyanobacterium bins.349]